MLSRVLVVCAALVTLLAVTAPAAAQDAMEVQRCIWRCQHSFPDLGRAYSACVRDRCDEPTRRPAATPRAPAAAAAASPAGSYSAPAAGLSATVTATTQPDVFDMRVQLSAPGCVGSVEGPARMEGGRLVMSQRAPGAAEACVLTATPSPGGLLLGESGCTEYRGPSCSFAVQVSRAGMPPVGGTSGAAEGSRWVYGTHPLIGRSAHIALGNEVIGLACGPGDDSLANAWPGALRISPGLLGDRDPTRSPGPTVVFGEPYSLGGTQSFERRPEGYLEALGDPCGVYVPELQRARIMRFLKGDLVSVEMEGRRPVMSFRQDGQVLRISSPAETQRLQNQVVVPLDGAGAAVRQLVRECRKLRLQIQAGVCGSGD